MVCVNCTVITELLLIFQVEYTDLSMAVEGLVARSSVDQYCSDVVESLERLCESSSPIGAPECSSIVSVVLLTVLSCLVSVLCTYMFIQSKA